MNPNLVIALIGIISGSIVGLVGSPGYTLLVPLMVFLNLANFNVALGTFFMAIMIPITLLPAYTSYKRNNINITYGLILMLTIWMFSFLFSHLSIYVPEKIKFYLGGIINMLVGIWYFWYSQYITN